MFKRNAFSPIGSQLVMAADLQLDHYIRKLRDSPNSGWLEGLIYITIAINKTASL